ncbi:alpha/beta hydrolase [Deinococcus sp. KSM4-11]|uniref:alpha/beta hydrolase n=1 Tax=Deinococcus sp. KSM4-11 TaxID=2568654 RepID=UPI001F10CEE9|nr:alpha/beta fold hydrolase [Deinococcus sp. KSM4-11]
MARPFTRVHVLILIAASATLGSLLWAAWTVADALVWAPPVRRRLPSTRVLKVDDPGGEASPAQLTLTRNAATVRPGVLGLEWEDDHGNTHLAQVGPVLGQTRRTVTRSLHWQDAPLAANQAVRPSTEGLGTPASRGLTYQDVVVPAEHGLMPAWLIQGDAEAPLGGRDWVIVTHGYHGLRRDALRILPTFARLGLTSLTITFRNAHGAPRTRQGVYRLSAEEWLDLEAAVRYARAHGAERLLLMGFSMGGAITLSFLRYSALASRISGVILDSPPLEWRSLIRHYARRYHLLPLAGLVEWLTAVKSGQDFDAIDHHSVMEHFTTPMLLFHGSEDQTVPVAHVERLAQARPDIVEYHRVEGAEHVGPWNIDPAAYEEIVTRFVERILGSGSVTTPESTRHPTAED